MEWKMAAPKNGTPSTTIAKAVPDNQAVFSVKRICLARNEKTRRVSLRTGSECHQRSTINQPSNPCPFPVAGIGASAGGLEAIIPLLKNLPDNPGMALIIVQHLEPTHKSMLADILTQSTAMPVREITDNLELKPNHIYVIPPNSNLSIYHGRFRLTSWDDLKGIPSPIDHFFHSLAENLGPKAIGIILSGTSSDGTAGLRAIKAAGGISFAQAPETSKYGGMPRDAIAAGDVDFVLPPREIAKELAMFGRPPSWLTSKSPKVDAVLTGDYGNLNRIFGLLRAATGVDYSCYKETTTKRRIMRRMVLNNIEEFTDYVRYLQHHPAEIKALSQDILIGVTSFFREPETFRQLKDEIFPKMIQNKPADGQEPLRIWVPGCSTGEEAYSIAIAFLEFSREQHIDLPIQIFATDLNPVAIAKARSGIYPGNIRQEVTAEQLDRFFIQVNQGYQINKTVRDLCIFAEQNIVKDPPFSRLDLISCCNVLIYLGPVLQRKVIPIFHYALKPDGYLLLGTSESIGGFADLFRLVDKNHKFYLKRSALTPLNFDFTVIEDTATELKGGQEMNNNQDDSQGNQDILKEADRIMLAKYTPAGIIVNDKMEIVQFRGQTAPYLTHAPGLASLNLYKMLKPDVVLEFQKAIHRADKEERPVRKEGLRMNGNDPSRNINIEIFPFRDPVQAKRFFLIAFEETVPASLAKKERTGFKLWKTGRKTPADGNQQLIQLKQELAATVEYQQSIIEQRETANEELRAANEEIQSSNEELQSMQEEMETAKEELQATNEELTTVNDELRKRNLELSDVNSDLNNLLSSINIPIVILGNDLRIRRITATAGKVLNLIPTDVGRPLSDIKPNIDLPQLERMILEVISTLAIKEQEVQDRWGHWYSLCIRPYRTLDNKIDGVVLILFDINTVKLNQEQIQISCDYAAITETIREPFLVLDAELRVKLANRSFYQTFQVSPAETEHRPIFALGNGQWNIPALRALLEEILPKDTSFSDFKVEHDFPQIGRKVMLLNARRVTGEGKLTPLILLAFEDITAK
jgi:two-component system CheB/CheR fusion protein